MDNGEALREICTRAAGANVRTTLPSLETIPQRSEADHLLDRRKKAPHHLAWMQGAPPPALGLCPRNMSLRVGRAIFCAC